MSEEDLKKAEGTETQTTTEPTPPPVEKKIPLNIILVGLVGSGKSDIGWNLARRIGYGFFDFDRELERLEGKSKRDIVNSLDFDTITIKESRILKALGDIKFHVILPSFHSSIIEENWNQLKNLGTVVWLKDRPEDIAIRLIEAKEHLERHHVLKKFASLQNLTEAKAGIIEALNVMQSECDGRFKEAAFIVEDRFSFSDFAAEFLRQVLTSEKLVKTPERGRPLRRWQ